MTELTCDVLIVGGGTGGCAAAMAAADLGVRVILTETTPWVGGQLTSQLVPPDEHPWIESFGCTARYRTYRTMVRAAYQPLLREPVDRLNPGGGWVSRLCHVPSVGLLVLDEMLARPKVDVRRGWTPTGVTCEGDSVHAVEFATPDGPATLYAAYVLDATELGDLLPMAGAEYRIGSEAQAEFDEPHATPKAEPDNVQAFTWCFLLSHDPGADHTLEKPDDYEAWQSLEPPNWTGPQLSLTFPDPITLKPRALPIFSANQATLFAYRQVDRSEIYQDAAGHWPTTCVNWPQNDAFVGTVLDVPEAIANERLNQAKRLNFSLLYWLQMEAPREDGGVGYPGLFLRPDLTGTTDGMALSPYHREGRRMVTRFTVTETMVGADGHPGLDRAPALPKSVGVGHYRIDLHPSANGRGYIDIPSLPFQIPLGSLIPVRLQNLLPACKNLGVTHITNGCYRLHPVEWNVGEAAGLLAAFCVKRRVLPVEVYEQENLWSEFEQLVLAQGIETIWPAQDLTLPA